MVKATERLGSFLKKCHRLLWKWTSLGMFTQLKPCTVWFQNWNYTKTKDYRNKSLWNNVIPPPSGVNFLIIFDVLKFYTIWYLLGIYSSQQANVTNGYECCFAWVILFQCSTYDAKDWGHSQCFLRKTYDQYKNGLILQQKTLDVMGKVR